MGLATWSTILPFGYARDNSSSSFTAPIPLPFYWRVPVADKWNLNIALLLSSASYQISQTDTYLLGLTFGSGFGYGSGKIGFVFTPQASFYYRQKLSPTIALEFEPNVTGNFKTGGAASTFEAEIDMGPLFQLTPVFALRARVALNLSNGYGANAVAINSVAPAIATQFTVPLSVTSVWSIHRQWDLDFGYSFTGIGYSNGYMSHNGTVTAVHYW